MNERIRELIDQATEHDYTTWDSYNQKELVYYKFNQEKFAELIIRECMKESMEEIVPDEEIAQEQEPLIREYLKGNNQGIVDAVVRFRNHFGLE